MSAKYAVGQRVWIFTNYGRGRTEPKQGEVVKVGRTLVTVTDGSSWRDSQYRMESGRINDGYGHSWIKTDQEKADDERRQKPADYLQSVRMYDVVRSQISTDALERIAAIVRAELGESS